MTIAVRMASAGRGWWTPDCDNEEVGGRLTVITTSTTDYRHDYHKNYV